VVAAAALIGLLLKKELLALVMIDFQGGKCLESFQDKR